MQSNTAPKPSGHAYEHHLEISRWRDGNADTHFGRVKRLGFAQIYHVEREALDFAARMAESEGLLGQAG